MQAGLLQEAETVRIPSIEESKARNTENKRSFCFSRGVRVSNDTYKIIVAYSRRKGTTLAGTIELLAKNLLDENELKALEKRNIRIAGKRLPKTDSKKNVVAVLPTVIGTFADPIDLLHEQERLINLSYYLPKVFSALNVISVLNNLPEKGKVVVGVGKRKAGHSLKAVSRAYYLARQSNGKFELTVEYATLMPGKGSGRNAVIVPFSLSEALMVLNGEVA